MFSIETMQTARDWVIAEIETGRCLIPMPHDLDVVKRWSDQDLVYFSDHAMEWNFSKPLLVNVPKRDGSFRPGHVIPPQDRLIINACLIHHYNQIREYVDLGVDYNRPLPKGADDCFLRQDYHDTYIKFKDRLIADEQANKWICHADIKNFAGSCRSNDILVAFQETGVEDTTLHILHNAFESWGRHGLQGCPQGYGFTDIILKVVMASIDRDIIRECGDDISYYRYVDDIQLSADSDERIERALKLLNQELGLKGLSLKEDQILKPKPEERGIGHAFQPDKVVEGLIDVLQKNEKLPQTYKFDKDNPHRNLIGLAYSDYISPYMNGRGQKPNKYLWSYIFRHMRKINEQVKLENPGKMTKLDQLVPRLSDAYPDRFAKIINASFKSGRNDFIALTMFQKYFQLDELNNREHDYHRLVVLDAFKKINYQIPRPVINGLGSAMFELLKVQPQLFAPHSRDISQIQQLIEAPRQWTGRGFVPNS